MFTHSNSVKVSRGGAAAAGVSRWESPGVVDSGWGTWLAGKKGTGPALAITDACPVPTCPAEGKAPQMIQKRQRQLHADLSVVLTWGFRLSVLRRF